MKDIEFVNIAKDIANNYKTLYVMGCFGAPMSDKNKQRYTHNHPYNKRADRTKKIKAASKDTFGFDCVCLVKGILWGWNGDANAIYGGAQYNSNGVPDVGADQMMKHCTCVFKDFSNIVPGEVVHMPGHIGIYIGDGLAVECTPIWKDGVQITAIGNIGKKKGYNTRTWSEHGKLKFIEYTETPEPPIPEPDWPKSHTVQKGETLSGIAKMYYGNGDKKHYMFIANANNISNPNLIKVGQVLIIPEYTDVPEPEGLKVGDKVKIIGTGNGSSYGTLNTAYGIGWTRNILKIYNGRPYPYQVGNNSGVTGYYKAEALQKK